MKYQHLLSPQEILYLKSRIEKTDKKINKSELKIRIREKVEIAFDAFDIILSSKEVDRSYLNTVFPYESLRKFMAYFCRKEENLPLVVEQNQLKITQKMLSMALNYYKSRFAKTKFYQTK